MCMIGEFSVSPFQVLETFEKLSLPASGQRSLHDSCAFASHGFSHFRKLLLFANFASGLGKFNLEPEIFQFLA